MGIYLRGGRKCDREVVRDYWIKPLLELGIVHKMIHKKGKGFIPGHLVAKSNKSCYKLDAPFVELLMENDQNSVKMHFNDNEQSKRMMLRSKVVEYTAKKHGKGKHYDLIQTSIKCYASIFLKDFEVVYVDDSDGTRISESEQRKLKKFELDLTLNDVYPDVILANKKGALWFIEAVTSDGEVDDTKIKNLKLFCDKHSKDLAGATTTYLNWSTAAKRQNKIRNLASGSYFWIANDPTKQFKVEEC